jgi:hypothetical protein
MHLFSVRWCVTAKPPRVLTLTNLFLWPHNQPLGVTLSTEGWLGGSSYTFPVDTPGLDAYFFDWSESGAWEVPLQPITQLWYTLPTSPTSTRGEHVITTMSWDTLPNQLSHFISCIFFRVNVLSRFTLNSLIYYSSIITNRGLHVSCYTAPILIAW